MSETRADCKSQLGYMLKNKPKYLSSKNPNRISLKEFERRIGLLRKQIRYG